MNTRKNVRLPICRQNARSRRVTKTHVGMASCRVRHASEDSKDGTFQDETHTYVCLTARLSLALGMVSVSMGCGRPGCLLLFQFAISGCGRARNNCLLFWTGVSHEALEIAMTERRYVVSKRSRYFVWCSPSPYSKDAKSHLTFPSAVSHALGDTRVSFVDWCVERKSDKKGYKHLHQCVIFHKPSKHKK